MGKTRRNHSGKRKTMRQKGGRRQCPYRTGNPFDQWIINIWQLTIRTLQEYDIMYRGEFHVIGQYNTCNLFVWKKCETSDAVSDNHLDIYFSDPDTYQLGISVTRNGRHQGRFTYDLSYASDYSNNDMATEIAEIIDEVYNSSLRCAKYDFTWGSAGQELVNRDERYRYNFNCNRMTYFKDFNDEYSVEVRWQDDDVYSFILEFRFYFRGRVIDDDTYSLEGERNRFCNQNFFRQMARALDRMYNDYYQE